ncbi:MAG TPA: PadR family transcriptional regulator [Planctomycetota bacterium]|nr:PadR family transcriptional regulator [Planctomycetota bacterium]
MAGTHQELCSPLIRHLLLHHAADEEMFGLGIIEELRGPDCLLGADTRYPLLHGFERDGDLRSARRRTGSRIGRPGRATARGHRALRDAKGKVRELFGTLFEGG